MEYNAFPESMAGVGGLNQSRRFNNFPLATYPKPATADCGVPNVLANPKVWL
jgi:hypothetical protein